MLEKFVQNNKAERLRRWLDTIDLQSADILQTEKNIYSALTKGSRKEYWLSTPVAPFAEPVDMNALVGDLFSEANQEVLYHVGRLDDLYLWLSETNNVLKSELESVEKAVIQATDAIQDINIVIGDENRNFLWVSDSFNNSSFVDNRVSTCLVDTDYGMVTLGPQELKAIVGFNSSIDREVTNGIPGANLYIVNPGKLGTAETEASPVLETADTRSFSTIFDLDPSTWFEVERNFVPLTQKVTMRGRSYRFDEAGTEKNVQEITAKLDWSTNIVWPDGFEETGGDGKGRPIAEFRNLDTESPVLTTSINPISWSSRGSNDPKVVFAFDIVLDTPTSISAIKILPFTREDSSPITVEAIEAITDGNVISVIRDVELGTNRSTTRLQREILRRTGVQLTGSLFSVPTDRDISKVRIILSSKPNPVKNGFAHIFQDILTEYRTERNHVLWRTANTWKEWGRHAYNENVPKITSSFKRPGIIGTSIGISTSLYTLGSIFNNVQAARRNSSLSNPAILNVVHPDTAALLPQGIGASINAGASIARAIQTSRIGGSLGMAGTWLGRATPYIGAFLALDQLVGGFFSVKKSSKVLDARLGYDVFKGQRAAVGLRDVTLVKSLYSNESVIQSTKREFPGLVSKIGLFVDEHVPEHWGAGDWLSYYVSVDGVTWKAIPKLTDSTLEKSLVLTEPTKSVFFRAILRGNSADLYHTPELRHYALQGLPVA